MKKGYCTGMCVESDFDAVHRNNCGCKPGPRPPFDPCHHIGFILTEWGCPILSEFGCKLIVE